MTRHPARMLQVSGRSRRRNSRCWPGVPSGVPFGQVQLNGELPALALEARDLRLVGPAAPPGRPPAGDLAGLVLPRPGPPQLAGDVVPTRQLAQADPAA